MSLRTSELYRIQRGKGKNQISLLTVKEFWMSGLTNVVSTGSFIEELLGNLGWFSRECFSMQKVTLSGSMVNIQRDPQRLGFESVDEENAVFKLRWMVEFMVNSWTSKGWEKLRKWAPLRQAWCFTPQLTQCGCLKTTQAALAWHHMSTTETCPNHRPLLEEMMDSP